LNQEAINHLSRFIASNEIKAAVKILPTKKSPVPDGFTAENYLTFKEELIAILLKLLHEIGREGAPLNSFYEDSIIHNPK
jgi:hypothetical protein